MNCRCVVIISFLTACILFLRELNSSPNALFSLDSITAEIFAFTEQRASDFKAATSIFSGLGDGVVRDRVTEEHENKAGWA